jgi:NAD-dependent SIR2 family protein deacetylase
MKVKVKTSFVDCAYTDAIICPYCGHKFSDSWEYMDEDSQITECDRCGRPFTLYTQTIVSYNTRPIAFDKVNDSLWEHGHVFEDNLTEEQEYYANTFGTKLEVVDNVSI